MPLQVNPQFRKLYWRKFGLFHVIPVLLWVVRGVDTDSEAWLTRAFNQDLALPELYNKHLRPQHKGPADTVFVGLKIYSIGPISESDMTMQIDMYFRTLWRDERLKSTFEFLVTDNSSNYYIDSQREKEREREKKKWAETTSSSTFSQEDNLTESEIENVTMQEGQGAQKTSDIPGLITLGQEYAEAIWTPDIYFPDSVNIERPGKDLISDSMVLALYNDSRLFQSMRLQMKIRCKLALTLFPMDIQHCDICLESYQYHTGDVQLTWWKGKLEMDKTKMKKYGVANFHIDYDSFVNSTITDDFGFGFNYTTLCVQVRLVRKLSIFLITMYLPSISLVALSWVGFWIDKRAVPARASLTITTILAQITLITGTANQFPGIADLKVADLYLIINFFFVFASLIEFALVSYEPPVKTMAKSWLQSTREKLKQKPNATPKTEPDSTIRRKSLHNLILDSRKSQQKLKVQEADSGIGEVLKNSAAHETPHASPDHKSTNGYVTKDKNDKNEVPAKNEETMKSSQNPANSSPLSLRQAILRRDKILELKEFDSIESQSDMETTPVMGLKHAHLNPLKNHETLLYDLTKASKNGRTESPSSTSPLLPPVTPLNNVHSSPRFKKTKNNNNMLFNSPAYSEHEFVEIKDIGRDLVPKQKPVQREVRIMTDNKPGKENLSPETAKSLNMQSKPLETLIKLDKSPATRAIATREFEDANASATPRKKKIMEKKEKKEAEKQESRICRFLKKYFPCLRPIIEYFQSDQFSKDNADSVSKWLFPTTFAIWNVLYFSITLTLAGRLSTWYF